MKRVQPCRCLRVVGAAAPIALLVGCAGLLGAERHGAIEIVGPPDFVRRTRAALELLASRATPAYREIEAYVGRIRLGDCPGMDARAVPPTFEVGARSARASTSWYAGVIVHDAFHSQQYHAHRAAHGLPVPDAVWTGTRAEREAIAHQLAVLRTLGAPPQEIAHLESQDGSHWDLDADGARTERDRCPPW